MSEPGSGSITPGRALRDIQQAQAGLRKARQALVLVRGGRLGPEAREKALRAGWESLVRTHRVLAEIPVSAATEEVMTKQIALERYATALLVRLRRLVRGESGPADLAEDDDWDETL